ncbi:TPA: acid-activated periplasmic chaperone HdeB [Citrobacter freundii]|uniref:Acid stress chaperone HdeB n=3 Tax=Enterobacteriaceae TaxID=543 RepID=A0A9P3SJN7_CITFR|nr:MULTISPECIES: acid-activated periplasmic chaperone HdeB [Enterobacteriaceae]POV67138.1 HdeB family protein [Citrobacter freundii complex sp. CFNIH11]AYL47689.1 HdeB family protein [Citrobacter freundii]AYY48272.1 acid-activated periplasmic chaperone HdeB [Citrobacter freundii]EIN8655617.1 acid-activated periplasmic chaperone HdeB [Citrobacter freundii]EIX7371826.1 acid-activated periplasmic chaperone HdeB [Citrobacter freundii]
MRLYMKRVLITLTPLLSLFMLNVPVTHAADNSPDKMTCQEFINLNPKAMLPVAWWMLNEETVYKGGDSVSLNETDLTSIPQVIEYCKRNPQSKLYSFKDK